MKSNWLNVIYYSAIVVLLLFAANEYRKGDRKFIAALTAFVAIITGYFAFTSFKRANGG